MLLLSRLELSRMKIQFSDAYLSLFKDAENELLKIGKVKLYALDNARDFVG